MRGSSSLCLCAFLGSYYFRKVRFAGRYRHAQQGNCPAETGSIC